MIAGDWTVSNTAYFIVDFVMVAICLFMTSYSMYHIFFASKEIMRNVDKCMTMITLSCYILWSITSTFELVAYYFEFINFQKQAGLLLFYFWFISYLFGKCLLYLIYIYRLYITFRSSTFAYSKMKIIISIAVVWTLQTLNVLGVLLFGALYAANDLSMAFEISILITDVLLVLYTLCLFIKPILKLMKTIKHMHAEEHKNSLKSDSRSNLDLPQPSTSGGYISTCSNIELVTSPSSTTSGESETVTSPSTSTKKSGFFPSKQLKQQKNEQHEKLLRISAKVALLTLLSLSTTFMWQILWIISLSIDHSNYHLYSISFLYATDSAFNAFCLYLSNKFAKQHYNTICVNCVKLDAACIAIIKCCA